MASTARRPDWPGLLATKVPEFIELANFSAESGRSLLPTADPNVIGQSLPARSVGSGEATARTAIVLGMDKCSEILNVYSPFLPEAIRQLDVELNEDHRLATRTLSMLALMNAQRCCGGDLPVNLDEVAGHWLSL